MARVVDHLSAADLERRDVSCADPVEARHIQAIWLPAQGRTVAATAAVTAFGGRWVEQLLERYNASGPAALANGLRRNGCKPKVLTPEMLNKLRVRLAEPPPDGGLWSSRKVAAFLAEQGGLDAVAPQRGWDALRAIGWSRQRQRQRLRPRNPKSATPERLRRSKKAGRGRCRGSSRPSGRAGRGVRHR